MIVNNASVLGWRAQGGQAHYAAAKAGVMARDPVCGDRSRAARRARERGGTEPRHAREPGQGNQRGAARGAHLARGVRPSRREPWEVANVIVFLASDYSSYMTGEVVSVSSQHA